MDLECAKVCISDYQRLQSKWEWSFDIKNNQGNKTKQLIALLIAAPRIESSSFLGGRVRRHKYFFQKKQHFYAVNTLLIHI